MLGSGAALAVACVAPGQVKPGDEFNRSQPGSGAPGSSTGPPHRVKVEPADPAKWRGVWVNHDLLSQNRTTLGRVLDQFADAGLNVLFPNVWFRGYVLYPGSALAPQDPRFAGWDPLKTVVEEGHMRGMKVLPWFEYGFITHYNTTGDPRDVGKVLDAHGDWAALNRAGQVPLPHTDHKVYFYSLSPAVPAARGFYRDLVLEALKHAPVDGVQVDRTRFPASDTSYDTFSREAFKQVKADPQSLTEDDADWVRWRKQQVSTFMADLRRAVATVAPSLPLTSAVLPSSANAAHYQDWGAWSAAGNLDVATPLAFNASLEYVRREIDFAKAAISASRARLVVGIAAMHAGEPNLRNQVQAATKAGAGVALWDDVWVKEHLTAVSTALAE
jgi:uncharacterized lipoprotein YddW (UPF0748 family)